MRKVSIREKKLNIKSETTQDQLNQAVGRLNEIQTSASWQLTKPLRFIESHWPAVIQSIAAIPKALYWLFTLRLSRRLTLRRQAKELLKTRLFNIPWYIQNNPDIVLKGLNPILHWLKIGWKQKRNPIPLFHVAWYLREYPDVAISGDNPLLHYLSVGVEEGRNPCPLFDSSWYLQKYPDVTKSGANPLAHYIKHGATDGYNPGPSFNTSWYVATYPAVKTSGLNPLAYYFQYGYKNGHLKCFPEDLTELPILRNKRIEVPVGRIAVVAHVFFVDLIEEILSYLKNIPFPYDLYVSTNNETNQQKIHELFAKDLPNVRKLAVHIIPNRGRNYSPLLVEFAEDLFQYDYICHIHSKKSSHAGFGEIWRKHMFDGLLGNIEIVRSILSIFETDQDVGVVFPFPPQEVLQFCNWGQNKALTQELFGRLDIDISLLDKKPLQFPAGSMFWFRPSALCELLSAGFSWEDFPLEPIAVDGTLAHAIERSIFYVAKHNGFKTRLTKAALTSE